MSRSFYIEDTPQGEPVKIWIDGKDYTLDDLRNHIARSHALTTVARWLDDELRTTRRQRRLLHHWQQYGHRMQTTARTQAEELATLKRQPEHGCYALERAASTKER